MVKLKGLSLRDKNSFVRLIFYLIVFLLMFVWNIATPLYDDDIYYSNETFMTILKQGVHDYFSWNNRFFGQSIMRLLSGNNQVVVSACNAFVFVVLLVLIVKMAKGKEWHKIWIYIITLSLMIIYIPAFGQTILWRSGAGNYMYPMVIILLFMNLYTNTNFLNKKISFDDTGKIILFLFFAVVAGWQNENTSGGMILILLLKMGIDFFERVKHNWAYYGGILFSLIGYLFLILGPGSHIRTARDKMHDYSIQFRIFTSLATISKAFINEYATLVVALVVLLVFALNFWGTNGSVIESCVWMIGGIATIYALVLSTEGQQGGRTYFGGIIFLIIAIIELLPNEYRHLEKMNQVIIQLVVSLIIIGSVMSLIIGFVDSIRSSTAIKDRYDYIATEIKNGKKNIAVSQLSYMPETKYSINYGLMDVGKNENIFPNKGYTQYFYNKSGVKITVKIK